MTNSIKHTFYIVIAAVGLVWCWANGLAWIAAGGNLFNLPSFFIESYRSGSAAAFLTVDIAIAWLTFMVWVVGDATKIGLGAGKGWLFVGLSFLGTCFAFPVYLVLRERHLDRQAGSSSPQ